MTASDLMDASPAIPIGEDGPAFSAPWEAKVFAMTLSAYDAGVFTWKDWAQTLGAELAKDAPGAPCKPYYEHWLTAFEKLLATKGITSLADLASLQQAWDKAARATPHGEPIALES